MSDVDARADLIRPDLSSFLELADAEDLSPEAARIAIRALCVLVDVQCDYVNKFKNLAVELVEAAEAVGAVVEEVRG